MPDIEISQPDAIDGKLPASKDDLLEKIQNVFLEEYEPVHMHEPGVEMMSTIEIYKSWQALYPSDYYGPGDVANWLHRKGFHFTNMGDFKMEWMLKKNN
jgi:hypothetical protein